MSGWRACDGGQMCAAIAQQPPAVYATAAYTDARKDAPIYLEEAEALQTMVGLKKFRTAPYS